MRPPLDRRRDRGSVDGMVRLYWLFIALLVAATSIEAADGKGEQLYRQNCVGCHGSDGTGGMPGTPDLTDPAGALVKTDSVLLASIIKGTQGMSRGMAMPPRGGNASLTDDDLRATLGYLRRITGIRKR